MMVSSFPPLKPCLLVSHGCLTGIVCSAAGTRASRSGYRQPCLQAGASRQRGCSGRRRAVGSTKPLQEQEGSRRRNQILSDTAQLCCSPSKPPLPDCYRGRCPHPAPGMLRWAANPGFCPIYPQPAPGVAADLHDVRLRPQLTSPLHAHTQKQRSFVNQSNNRPLLG